MRITVTRRVQAPQEKIWQIICDGSRYPEFMDGVTRWQAAGEKTSGLGARYTVKFRVGSAHVGGLAEIVAFEPPGDLSWRTVTGVDLRYRWRLREREPGVTEVTLRGAYHAPGGVFGVIVDRVSAYMVKPLLERSLANLAALVESAP